MKLALITVIGLFLSINTHASTIFPPDSTTNLMDKGSAKYLISEGKKVYNETNYRSALLNFREALAKDKNNPTATYWVGECHMALGNYDKALKYALLAYDMSNDIHKEVNFLLGVCYHKLGKIDEALVNYEKASKIINETRAKSLRIPLRIEECKRAKKMITAPIKVKIAALGVNINTRNDEYAAILTNGGKTLYFSSRRADNLGGGTSTGDRKYFSDIYVSQWDEVKKEWGVASNSNDIVQRLNSEGFDAASFISSDGSYIYLSINTDGLSKPKPLTKSADLYYSRLSSKGTWGSPKPMPKKTINTMYFEISPSFTADENTMYFVSERAGGEGMSDIWKATKTSKTKWSKPINLGPIINTPYNETTVFITPDEKYMFFSSEGHKGMGGYDIYYSINNDGVWTSPINIGFPLNSVSDETQYYPKLGKAYYSKISQIGDGGVGLRDIFEVDISDLKLED
jgi:tetratricopeptide (TPR) repeat protein